MESRPMRLDILGRFFSGTRFVSIDTFTIPSFSTRDLFRLRVQLPAYSRIFPRSGHESYLEIGTKMPQLRERGMAK